MYIPKAAIFDLDGTLLDSMWMWKKCDERFLEERGHKCTKDYTDAVKSMGWQDGAEYTIARYGLDETPEEVIEAWFQLSRDFYDNEVKLKPFARDYLMMLKEQGVPMAIATSMEPRSFIEHVLETHGIADLFKAVLHSADFPGGKNSEYVYLAAAEAVGTKPENCAVFEDVLTAIRGARKGGFNVVAIYDSISAHDWPVMSEEATLAVKGWDELLKHNCNMFET